MKGKRGNFSKFLVWYLSELFVLVQHVRLIMSKQHLSNEVYKKNFYLLLGIVLTVIAHNNDLTAVTVRAMDSKKLYENVLKFVMAATSTFFIFH